MPWNLPFPFVIIPLPIALFPHPISILSNDLLLRLPYIVFLQLLLLKGQLMLRLCFPILVYPIQIIFRRVDDIQIGHFSLQFNLACSL
jgi:hypothetical protein